MFNTRYLNSFLFFSIFLLCRGSGDEENIEVSCNINVKKAIHCVSENFLSFSIDPAVVLAGVNLSENSLRLAKHLSPAFIKLAGPTTQFIKYVDNDDGAINLLSEDGNSVRITPSIWFGVNEWLKLTKLTPIFGINDVETVGGVWNPENTLPLFEISQQLNISCYWQLGYDSSDKNVSRYEQDLNILQNVISAFGNNNDSWKVIGSDMSTIPSDQVENLMIELSNVTEAVMWEPRGITGEQFPQKDVAFKILQRQSSKPRTKVWSTVPKSTDPLGFSSALLWAKQIGSAAKAGFEVIFRQPRIYELFTDTPIYWLSVLHKKLMGCCVLETKSSIFQEDTNIFVHCAKKQNSFVRRGALSVMIVNDKPTKYKAKVKLGNTLPEKSMEVQSYILTSTNLNSTKIYLNDQLLSPAALSQKSIFEPKIRRTKSTSHILLSLPAHSIGFFVLPGARCPLCIDKEKETHLLLEEMEQDQNIPLSEEAALSLGPRGLFVKHNALEEITHNLKEEMKSDESYYKSSLRQYGSDLENPQINKQKMEEGMDEKDRKYFIDRVKLADKHKKAFDLEKKRDNLKKLLFDKTKSIKSEFKQDKPKNLELTTIEIEKLLKDRAIERAAQKNIIFTDEELDALIRKASKTFVNKYRGKRSLSVATKSHNKRDINMQLMEKYSHTGTNDPNKNHYKPIKKKSIVKNKKIARGRRDLVLSDLKTRIAERKRFWDSKKEELLSNSLGIKESIKDKIRELKSNMRFKRDVNTDVSNKNSKGDSKKSSKSSVKLNDEIEATIRRSGETSADVLEKLEFSKVHDVDDVEDVEGKAEIFAELATSDDLEEQELFDNAAKGKKNKLFDKKAKIDPFAVAYPSIEIVEPGRKRSKSKSKAAAEDKLQFLTSSDEFTDIEEDMPCIHEFFGPDQKKEKKVQNTKDPVDDVDDFYGFGRRKKREVEAQTEKIELTKRPADVTVIQITKISHDNLMPAGFFDDVFMDMPVVDKPLLSELINFEKQLMMQIKNGSADENQNNNDEQIVKEESLQILNLDKDTIPDHLHLVEKASDGIDPSEFVSQPENTEEISKTNMADISNKKEDIIQPNNENVLTTMTHIEKISDDQQPNLHEAPLRKRRSAYEEDHVKRKRPIKKAKTEKMKKNMSEQMHNIREKLQERKDGIDRFVHERKAIENEKKDHRKMKMKLPHLMHDKPDIKYEIEFPQFSARSNLVKRSNGFGDYRPLTADIPTWKPSDMPSLNTDVYYNEREKLAPPDDYVIFKNIFNKPHNLRKRFIDTDVEINENDIDVNAIKKEDHHTKDNLGRDKYHANNDAKLRETDFFKFKLPNNLEFEIINKETENKLEQEKQKDSDAVTRSSEVHSSLSEQIVDEDVLNVSKIEKTSFTPQVSDNNAPIEVIDSLEVNKDDDFDPYQFTIKPETTREQNDEDNEKTVKDENHRFRLTDSDEIDVIKTDKNTEIKLMHFITNPNENSKKVTEDGRIIPDIICRSSTPIESVEKLFGNIKDFFASVGKDFQQYLKQIGIN